MTIECDDVCQITWNRDHATAGQIILSHHGTIIHLHQVG
jgi:hypothetical protein